MESIKASDLKSAIVAASSEQVWSVWFWSDKPAEPQVTAYVQAKTKGQAEKIFRGSLESEGYKAKGYYLRNLGKCADEVVGAMPASKASILAEGKVVISTTKKK